MDQHAYTSMHFSLSALDHALTNPPALLDHLSRYNKDIIYQECAAVNAAGNGRVH